MLTAIIFDIERNSYVDGPGIRTTVFFKGCNLEGLWLTNHYMAVRTIFARGHADNFLKGFIKISGTVITTLCGNIENVHGIIFGFQ